MTNHWGCFRPVDRSHQAPTVQVICATHVMNTPNWVFQEKPTPKGNDPNFSLPALKGEGGWNIEMWTLGNNKLKRFRVSGNLSQMYVMTFFVYIKIQIILKIFCVLWVYTIICKKNWTPSVLISLTDGLHNLLWYAIQKCIQIVLD